ncbi:NAD(P)/FAD-dependent oxidoreductase [Amycolatopsis sp. SID8362]|uniref:NAD(P)/FAD-dependent oxidoreductase n=1 Tax=Amycolatopsis sp. SID8362 TaxID=2690346 RepID=UPI001368203C|nr:NAD(P)/FAD-dependent oxidoreductase [Amycolatopsis sp. SID8362]NBH11051.1 FAD-dependent oxidoreductase [Amycolatopsis sp. SID8362]NED47742.1 NAD(P)/FAD-dependent oxidoreductase [Amycolatopsis sp. SID8362]
MTENSYDVLVVGGGAAGLNAALMLGRARRRVAVVDARAPRNAPAEHMHGFLSRDGLPPSDLLEIGRAELAGYGVDVLEDSVTRLEPGFTARLASGRELTARRVLVATGVHDDLPGLPGLRESWGTDAVTCPYCHGYEVRDQPLGVLGTEPMSVEHALLVRQWSPDVVYFAHTAPPSEADRERLDARGIRVVDGVVAAVRRAGGRLTGIELGDRFVPRTALFLRTRTVPHDELLRGLGYVEGDVDPSGKTSVPGVWAAGNVVDARATVIIAAAQGAAAAGALNHDLVTEDVERAVEAYGGFSPMAERAAAGAR